MIRRATRDDIPGIKTLLEQVLLVHHNGRPDIFKAKGMKYTDDEIAELIEKTEDPVFVYIGEDGKVLGHCFCITVDRPERESTYAYKTLFIEDLCIEETARGQHVGREMYEYVKRFAKDNGYYNLTLHAWECNPGAVGFYRHLGMQVQQYTMEELL